ncbi:uncharacterized protein LOC126607406 isoform X3 [Malus sylvestris]|uniref:uncharacterized protein LOC126607406 isoform X3 n=1 Tax=Malus sylvestris TaxID=3752 RepID=UPI0021ACCEA3|nr:uncharacterized protein LOC126607406 isoform X3 [Malus sylvestris]
MQCKVDLTMNMRFMQGTVRLTRFCMECDTPIDRQPSLICQFSNCPHYCHTNILSSPNMAYTSPGSTCYPGMAMRRIGFGCAILVPELETVESPNSPWMTRYKQSGLGWHKQANMEKEVSIPRSSQGQAI